MKLLSLRKRFFSAVFAIFIICTICSTSAISERGTSAERMKSPADVASALEILQSKFAELKGQNPPSFETQKTIVLKSGDCISRLVEMSQKADLSQAAQQDEFKKLFLKNAELLRHIIAYNRNRIDDVLEDKHGGTEDKSAFYSSPEWQQPQYLLSIASYWQGWNGYYGALLYTGNTTARTELLEEAAAGFTFAVLNIQEQSFVSRSILGRALCFKELKRYDKAQQDLQSVMSRALHEDPLYAQAGYERALLSYQLGDKARALQQIQQLEETVKPKAMSQQIKEKLRSLQTNIALATVE
jgi:tetratricopeptide (TPR) repeat protein